LKSAKFRRDRMSKLGKYIQYFVEGEDEEKVLSVLKTDMQLIVPGKVNKLNVVQDKISKARLMNLRPETSVVLVFDTDTYSVKVLEENIEILKKTSAVQSIICVTQVMNLEDELIRSCDIKNIRELTGSKNDSEYKHDLLKASNLAALLKKHGFDIKKFWIKEATGIFVEFKNESNLVKK
jgi:hypothetical protein